MTINEHYSSIFPDSTIDEDRERKPEMIKKILHGNEDWNITQLLSMLPKKKASANFDRKMAAAFSLELEREVQNENAKRILEKR